MSESTIAIVGSGIAGTALAYHLVNRGHDVVVFEYDCSDFDRETHRFANDLHDRFAQDLGAVDAAFAVPAERFHAVAHHMGTCRMGNAQESVTDPWCRVHGSPNLFVVGAANFAGTSGAVHPTLTLTALAIRAADVIADAVA